MNRTKRVINIGLVGGGEYCVEVLNKHEVHSSLISASEKTPQFHDTRIIAVADKDKKSPGINRAQKAGIKTFQHYQDLYDEALDIHLIILMDEEENLLEEIINTRPYKIRILSFEVFRFLWQDIGAVENELNSRTRDMETILNHIQDFIVVITPDHDIVEANQAFLTFMDHTREEVIGKKCYEILQKKSHFCDVCHKSCPITEIMRNRLPSKRIDHVQLDKGGKPFYLDDIIYPIWEKDGTISRFIKIGRDITELRDKQKKITHHLEKLIEERTQELNDTNAILLHQDKMASLGKLSAAVVHEVNNPIAGILNLLKLMKRINEEGNTAETNTTQFNTYLNLMETETKRISRIVSNLLAFSRQSNEELNRLDINELIERTILMNSNLIKINSITIRKKLSAQLPLLLGAEDKLQQVLINLLSNAIEAMETTEIKQLTIETRYSLKENRIYISFTDTGVGIPEEDKLKLYEPFFTTKKKGKGIGLGLSLVYGIIKKHHGKIVIRSAPDQGTTFQIDLPVDNVTDDLQWRETDDNH